MRKTLTIAVDIEPGDLKSHWVETNPNAFSPDAPLVEKFQRVFEQHVLTQGDPVRSATIDLEFFDEKGEPWAPCGDPIVSMRPYDYVAKKGASLQVIHPALVLRACDLRRHSWRRSVGVFYPEPPPTELRRITAKVVVEYDNRPRWYALRRGLGLLPHQSADREPI